MGFTIFQAAELPFAPRGDDDPRSRASLSDALTHSRANVWRYPPGTRGKRHRDLGQEELFVVLDGVLTVDLGEPPERHELPRGGVLVVEQGTILQLRNAGDDELVLFIYGARPRPASPSSSTACPRRRASAPSPRDARPGRRSRDALRPNRLCSTRTSR